VLTSTNFLPIFVLWFIKSSHFSLAYT
jgi:hypothetical protein